jgi:hypothetical protein
MATDAIPVFPLVASVVHLFLCRLALETDTICGTALAVFELLDCFLRASTKVYLLFFI